MDLGQIRCFVAAYEEGSFSKAARREHCTQPGLGVYVRQRGPRTTGHEEITDSRSSELNEATLSGDAGVEPRIGNVIEFGLAAVGVALPLWLKVVIRNRTNDGFGVEFLADTPDESGSSAFSDSSCALAQAMRTHS